jgi:hypothetical protein
MALPLRVERATPCDRSEATLAFAPQPQPETQMDPKNPNQIVAGTVFVQLPPHLSLPEEAGTLSPDQMNRLPKARHGIGLACEQAATAMEKASITVPEVTPDELRRAGMAAEAWDDVLADLQVVVEKARQANLLHDADAHDQLRRVWAVVSAQGKFDHGLLERFAAVGSYFGRGK